MPSAPLVQCLVEDAARLLELRPVVAYDDRFAWLVSFDDDTMVDIEYDAAADRLVFAGGIQDMAEMRRADVYEMLLQYNYLWTETDGARIAIDGVPGQAVLMVEKPLYGLTAAQLGRLLERLAVMQRAWREVLRAAAAGSDGEIDLEAPAQALSVSTESP